MPHLTNLIIILLASSENQPPTSPGSSNIVRGLALVIGMVMIAYFLLLRTQKRVAQSQKNGKLSARERVDRATKEAYDSTTQIQELMAELADLSRQINAQLDTRLTKAEILIQHADDRIEKLTKLLQQSPTPNATAEPSKQQPTLVTPIESNSQTAHTVPQTTAPTSQATQLITPDPEPPQKQSLLDCPQSKEIIELTQQGMTPIDIAQKVGRPVGEVQLILSLNGNAKK